MTLTATKGTHDLGGLYPDTWDEFIGQDQLKRQLMIACRSAKRRGEPLKHTLFAAGEGGVGKTALALLVSKELGTSLKIISGKVDVNQARIALAGMQRGDVLFYDEIHQVGKGDWLLHFLQDGVIMGPHGPERQPEITMLAATTEAGRIPEAVLSRFNMPTIAPYSDLDAQRIAELFAKKIFPKDLTLPSLWNYACIAEASSNNPRMIGKVLENLRDIAMEDPALLKDGDYDITEALQWAGLTKDGLTDLACRYLVLLLTEFGGTAGGQTIAERLQEPSGVNYTERLLMDKGMLAKTKTGRVLTQLGIARAKELAGD